MIEEKVRPVADVDAAAYQQKQRRRMIAALILLLFALGLVILRDRDFWFSSEPAADSELVDETPAPPGTTQSTGGRKPASQTAKSAKRAPAAKAGPAQATLAPVIANRAVLPPLEVEVVAGDQHRTLRPGSNSVNVDLQPRTPPQATEPATAPGSSPCTAI